MARLVLCDGFPLQDDTSEEEAEADQEDFSTHPQLPPLQWKRYSRQLWDQRNLVWELILSSLLALEILI